MAHSPEPMPQALSMQALALKLRARTIDESLADDILASRRAGVDFTARVEQTGFRQHGAGGVNRNSLLALFFLRAEAKETSAATRIEFRSVVESAPGPTKAKRAALAAGLGETLEEREEGEKMFATLVADNAKAARQLAREWTPSPSNRAMAHNLREEGRDIDRLSGWASEAQAFFGARKRWERVAERVLPAFSLKELLDARLPWECLVMAPFSARQALFEEARREPVLWVDHADHTPLSAICLMAGQPFAPEERTALLAQLRASGSPGASSNENNPFFVLAVRALENKPLDEELCRALRAAGHTPSTPGRNGETAMDLAQGGIDQMEGYSASSNKSQGNEQIRQFWENMFVRLEHADLQADIFPLENDATADSAKSSGPARVSRRI